MRIVSFSLLVMSVVVGSDLSLRATSEQAPSTTRAKPSEPVPAGGLPPPAPATAREVNELAAQIAGLSEKVTKLEAANLRLGFQLSALQDRNREISLDPTNPKKYQRVDTDAGFFLVSFENVETYLDGYRVFIEIGNLGSARYVGFAINTTWGPKYDWDKFSSESYKKWESEKQSKTLTFTEPLVPGAWNRVALILPATSARQLGFIDVSLDTNTVSFGGR